MMKNAVVLTICLFMAFTSANAQIRIVDALDNLPVAAASVFDTAGNMIGYTSNEGVMSDIPESAFPITLRCMGYEQLVIDKPEEKTWEMMPVMYELQELVVGLVERNIMKQTFYAREYFSMSTSRDTINYFVEHMLERFIPASKDAKFSGNSSLRSLNSRIYANFNIEGKDSTTIEKKASFPSMMALLKLDDEEILAPESFKNNDNHNIYEKPGISGISMIYKQNAYSFTTVEDLLAKEEDHSISPGVLKLLGMTMDVHQLYITHAYTINEEGVYLPKDLKEASYVFEANSKGKLIRSLFKTAEPVIIRSMVEIYLVDRDYLSKKEAKEEYKNKRTGVEFIIPSSVPPLNDATRRLVNKAKVSANQ